MSAERIVEKYQILSDSSEEEIEMKWETNVEGIRKQVKTSSEDEIVEWITHLIEYNEMARAGLVLAHSALNEEEKEEKCDNENHHLESLLEENMNLNKEIHSLRRSCGSWEEKYVEATNMLEESSAKSLNIELELKDKEKYCKKLEEDFIRTQGKLKEATETITKLQQNVTLLEKRCNELEKKPNIEDIEDEEEKSMVIKLMENLNSRHEFETQLMVDRFNNMKPFLEQVITTELNPYAINDFNRNINDMTQKVNNIYTQWDLPHIQTYGSFNMCPFTQKLFVTDIAVTKNHGEGWGETNDQRLYECFSPLTIYYTVDQITKWSPHVFDGGAPTEYIESEDEESYGSYNDWRNSWQMTLQKEDTYFPRYWTPRQCGKLTPIEVMEYKIKGYEPMKEFKRGNEFFEKKINEICELFGMRHNQSYKKEIQNPLNGFYFNLIHWVMNTLEDIKYMNEVFSDLKEFTTITNPVEAELHPNLVGVTDASLHLWFYGGAEEINEDHYQPFSNNTFIEGMWGQTQSASGLEELKTSEIKELCEESSNFDIENAYKNGDTYGMAIKCLEDPKWAKIFRSKFIDNFETYMFRFKDKSPTYQNAPDEAEAEYPYEDGMRMKDYYYNKTNLNEAITTDTLEIKEIWKEAFDFLLKFVKKSYEKYGDILHKIKHRSGASLEGITFFNYDMCYEMFNDECKLDKKIHTELMSEFRKKRCIAPNDLVKGGLKNYDLYGIFPDKEESLYFAKSITDKIAYEY